jgi:hypothetical protein
MMMIDYNRDGYAWALEQAEHLRARHIEGLDFAHLAEEIESMGKRERRALIGQLARLLAHLLKWEHQPERRGRSWALTIADAQAKVARLISENPSLQAQVDELMQQAYADARRAAAIETELELETFAEACPYDFDEVLTMRIDPH